MCQAFPDSDYYDPPALRVSHQPQLVQCSHRSTKFPRSQSVLFQLNLGSHYAPDQGDRSYVFVLSSFRSLRPRQKCMAYTPNSQRHLRTCRSLFIPLRKELELPSVSTPYRRFEVAEPIEISNTDSTTVLYSAEPDSPTRKRYLDSSTHAPQDILLTDSGVSGASHRRKGLKGKSAKG